MLINFCISFSRQFKIIEYFIFIFQIGVTLNINSTSFNDKGSLTSHLIEGTYNDLPPNLQSTDYIYGDFKIDFKNFKSQNPLKPNLHFVHIDENFALVYFCESSGPFKLSLGWILSRDLHPDFALLKNIEAKLKDLNLVDIRTLETVDQSHCSTNGNLRFLANGIRMLPVKDDGSTNEDIMFVRCMMMSSDTFFHDLLYCKEQSRENSRRNSLENSPVKSNPKTSG